MAQQTSISELRKQARSQSVAKMGGSNVKEFFEANKGALAAVLPKHMHADRMLKIAMHALRTTPALNDCNVQSLMGAVVQCSQLGLEPNTVLGHAYLLPFQNRRENRKDVQLIIGYKGLIDLARRSGQIASIGAYPVHENDHFRLRYGTNPGIEHEPELGERGEIIGFYAVATFKGGGYQFEFMSRREVDAIRDASQGYMNALRYNKDHPWISHYEQMGRKTVIRRLSKFLPLSIEFATASELDSRADAGQEQNLEGVLEGEYTVMPDDAPPADPPAEPEPEQGPDTEPAAETPAEKAADHEAPTADEPPAEESPQASDNEDWIRQYEQATEGQ